MKLNKKELQEDVFQTLGRLKVAISQDTERALELFEKVREDVSQMDIRIMHFEKNQPETINVGDENRDLEVEIPDFTDALFSNVNQEDEMPF